MGLDFAIDDLYATGWVPLDTTDCNRAPDGRAYPAVERARREFAEQGFEFSVRHVPAFGCYQAEWSEAGQPAGAVVGVSEAEAVVYALSQFRRRQTAIAAGA
ncbi:MAG: hypothetical protein ACF8R7_00755 [Phycisphaerales bacterium JB039]